MIVVIIAKVLELANMTLILLKLLHMSSSTFLLKFPIGTTKMQNASLC
jgi:hypothetical protein